jgi:predicted protein tyrosine phosphatase
MIYQAHRNPHLLFLCTANRLRSPTAEAIYKDDPRFLVRSAGTDRSAPNPVSQALLDWADLILVMERTHRNWIRKHFPEVYEKKRIVCLYIPDEFEYMEAGLVEMLRERVERLVV